MIARQTVIEVLGFMAFVAKFTLVEIVTINAILRVEDPVAIVTILAAESSDDEIAIPILRRVVRIRRVFALRILYCHSRYSQTQFMILLKERTGKIEVSAISERIECIAPPRFLIVHSVWGIRWIE